MLAPIEPRAKRSSNDDRSKSGLQPTGRRTDLTQNTLRCHSETTEIYSLIHELPILKVFGSNTTRFVPLTRRVLPEDVPTPVVQNQRRRDGWTRPGSNYGLMDAALAVSQRACGIRTVFFAISSTLRLFSKRQLGAVFLNDRTALRDLDQLPVRVGTFLGTVARTCLRCQL